MSDEQLKELQEYNLEYLEAQSSEEIFGGDYTSAVELKYAKKEIERLRERTKNQDRIIASTNNRLFKAIERLQDYDIVEDKEKVIEDTFAILRGDEE